LALTFGSTTLAAASVIAGFMGGMGMGAAFYHRAYGSVKRPVLLYGLLEMGIALTTALITLTFYHLPDVFADLARLIPEGWWFSAFRFFGVFVILLIPAALMGATFPALCTVLIHSIDEVDRHLGKIYGINTVGGAAGSLLAGLFLIERLGLSLSVAVANATNAAIGAGALAFLATRMRKTADRPITPRDTAIPTRLPRGVTGVVLLMSGLTTLGYEILWFRALRYTVGNSTYALTTVLVVFLVGLGLGSLFMRRAVGGGRAERTLALTQLGIGALAAGAMACIWLLRSSTALEVHISIFSQTVQARPWWWRLAVDAGLATAIMLPATLLMGLSFPLASRLYLGDVTRLSVRTGSAYLLANIGSVVGAILGGVLVLPLFGTIGGTKVFAATNVLLGIMVLRWCPATLNGVAGTTGRRGSRAVPVIVAAAVVGGLAWWLPNTLPLKGEEIVPGATDVVFVEEGDLATVQVLQARGDPQRLSMTIDGYQIGWGPGLQNRSFYRKQVMLVHLPMSLDPRIESALNVGLGSGATLAALTLYPRMRQIDNVEINPAVVRACAYFPESASLADPRVRLILDDAVHHLLRGATKYDLIVSDGKQHPFFAGNAALLCREFYQHVLRRLSERGLFIQWAPLGMLASDFSINLRTLCHVFPYVELFYFEPDSVFAIGSWQPLGVAESSDTPGRTVSSRPSADDDTYARSPAQAGLDPYFVQHATALYAHWVAGKSQLMRALGDGTISTWDRPILDFSAYKTTLSQREQDMLDNMRLLLAAEEVAVEVGDAAFRPPSGPYAESTRLLRRAFENKFAGHSAGAFHLAQQAVSVNPDDSAAQAIMNVLARELEDARARAGRR